MIWQISIREGMKAAAGARRGAGREIPPRKKQDRAGHDLRHRRGRAGMRQRRGNSIRKAASTG